MIQLLMAFILFIIGLYLYQSESELVDKIDRETGEHYQDVVSTFTGNLGWFMAIFAFLYMAAKALSWML
jgi:hypothetical protein|nr:MAG TPA: hypothetical protein [Caudoviricetes sp.]